MLWLDLMQSQGSMLWIIWLASLWLQNLLKELGAEVRSSSVIFSKNKAAKCNMHKSSQVHEETFLLLRVKQGNISAPI